ncbi:MAG: type 4a pilus biogenesis protein PilO [Patescibacteria group bacterium]
MSTIKPVNKISADKKNKKFFSLAEKTVNYRKLILESAVILFLISLLLVFGYFFKVLTYDINSAERNIDQQIVDLQTKLKQYERVEELTKRFGDLAKDVSAMLPTQSDLPEIFVFLEDTAKSNGLTMNNLEVSKETASDKERDNATKSVLSVALSGGDYFLLKNFLRDLENAGRFLDVTAISYRPEQQTYNLKISLYYLAE